MLNVVQNAGLKVDGIYGSGTTAAVKTFQKANGLTVDGKCGPKTWAKLDEAFLKASATSTTGTSVATFTGLSDMSFNVGKDPSLSGMVKVVSDPLYSVQATIPLKDGTSMTTTKFYFFNNTTKSYNLSGSDVDKLLHLDRLPAGNYKMTLTVETTTRKSASKTINLTVSDPAAASKPTTSAGKPPKPTETGLLAGKTGIQTFSVSANRNNYLLNKFKLYDFRSKDGTDTMKIDADLVRKLNQIQEHFGKTITVTSGYRSEAHNKSVGGSKNSKHLTGRAIDFTMTDVDPREVAAYAVEIGCKGVELQLNKDGSLHHFHIDSREGSTRYWVLKNGTETTIKNAAGFRNYKK